MSYATSGDVLSLTANTSGSGTNYPFSVSIAYDSADFSTPSFTASPASGNLAGGSSNTIYDSGTVTVTVNGTPYPGYTYGQSDTASTIATHLANNIGTTCSGNAAIEASPSGGTLSFQSCTESSSADYPFSISITYDTKDFSSASFYASPASGSLSGGENGTTDFDTGTVSITVKDASGTTHTATVNYEQGSTDSSIATALISAIGTSCGSLPVYAKADNTYTYRVDMYSCTAGGSTDYQFTSTSKTTNSNFTSVSFTPSPASGSLAGGADAGTTSTVGYSTTVGYAYDGDVVSDTDDVNGEWTYTYDGFNRIATGSCSEWTPTSAPAPVTCPGDQANLGYSYDYDRFGNRWDQTVTKGSGTQMALNFNASTENNRVDSFSYDAAGDVTNDGVHSYTYDAESRVTQVDAGSTATYVYNASGQRIEKTTSSGTVYYLYDLAGHMISELTSTGSWNRGEIYAGGRHVATYVSSTTYFDHGDWLGTERARTDVNGAISETCQGLPFGDGLSCSGSDVSPLHFTGKQRDSETGLDYFGARYDSSSTGRFMTPDWSASPTAVPYAVLPDPQSLNLYVYVRDNPVTSLDADGHICPICDEIEETAGEVLEEGAAGAASGAESGGEVGATVGTFAEPGGGTVAGGLSGVTIGSIVGGAIGVGVGVYEVWRHTHRQKPGSSSAGAPPGSPKAAPQAGHRKGTRPSTREKHQAGAARSRRDKGNEKADPRRRQHGKGWGKRPKKHKGPWPPRTQKD